MPDLRITRDHQLGFEEARKLAKAWADSAAEKLDMTCDYEEGDGEDCVAFKRSGVTGELRVTGDRFELDAKLGFLLGAFKDRIEQEITKNLDLLLQQKDPLQAFQQGAAKYPKA